MKIDAQTPPKTVMADFGRRIARRRLDLGMTQAEVAEQAGMGKRTVERIEAGDDAQLSKIIRLLCVLGLADGLDRMVPEPGLRPMELLKLKGKVRQRASSRRHPDKPGNGWQWGERQ